MTIRFGFLDDESRERLIALARDGSTISRVTRRANAIVLLNDGWSASDVAKAFLLDDDTIRGWHKLYEQRGIEGLTSFDMGGSSSYLSASLGKKSAHALRLTPSNAWFGTNVQHYRWGSEL